MRPVYVLDESLLRRNLSLIADIRRRADVEFILAFKAFALWRVFPVFREYIRSTTASSLCEARLAVEEFGSLAHTYSPAYTPDEFEDILSCSSHVTFNSLSQLQRFLPVVRRASHKVSVGLRINPEYSEIETELYNPCAAGSRFGVTGDILGDRLPQGVDGLHVHCHCESSSYALEHTLRHVEARFGALLRQAKWLNLGGGHLVTRADYDVEHLVSLLLGLHSRYPDLHIILEPGSAFAWQTGVLCSHVVDIVENHNIRTAILDVSFTCHMPDCLEMPYMPVVRGARQVPLDAPLDCVYRLGGNSCLSGDFMGSWQFGKPLAVGDEVVFEDMLHYTTVKTNTFNGVSHPDIALRHSDGTMELLRRFTYEDYRSRMC